MTTYDNISPALLVYFIPNSHYILFNYKLLNIILQSTQHYYESIYNTNKNS